MVEPKFENQCRNNQINIKVKVPLQKRNEEGRERKEFRIIQTRIPFLPQLRKRVVKLIQVV